jgi:two-component system, NarL family, sensor kinase
VALLITLAGVVVTLVALAQTRHTPGDFRNGLLTSVTYAIPYGITGAFLIVRRPDLPFGWLLSGAAVVVAVAAGGGAATYLAVSHGAGSGIAGVGFALQGTAFLPVAVQGVVNLRFPSGQVNSRPGRVLEVALVAGSALGVLVGVFGAYHVDVVRSDGSVRRVGNPLTDGTVVGRIAADLAFVIPVVILLGLLAGLGVVRRAWKATDVERDQLRWRAFGVVLAIALFPLAVSEVLPTAVAALDGLFFAATLVIPIVRYRLWAIDTIIRRSTSYALVTVVVAGGFAAIAAVGTALAGQRVGFIVAAAAVALAFAPARSRSQRLVDRLFYGQRNDPYKALSELGQRLSAVAAPGEVLPAVVKTVAESLRLPYVAIERPADGSVVAAHGDAALAAGEGVERRPLTYRGDTVGVLVAAPRRGETSCDERDRTVLADLGRHVGAAVHAEALTADLLDSRQRLVNAREEERRRLRRDLHDGLGPLLTGIGLNLDAARAHLSGSRDGTGDADGLLARAKHASAQAITDLRAIVYGLRPPALDDLGLTGAITTHAQRLAEGTSLHVSITAAQLPELPAAIEVAAFRLTVEAVTNVVRHSAGRCCRIHLGVDSGDLIVEVSDDGRSTGPWAAGVGLHAMRERVAELGGTLTAGPTPTGGEVHARLPLPTTNSPVRTRP